MTFSSTPVSAKIVGTGAYVPERILTNAEIEQAVPGSSAAWTYQTLGIRERRIARPDESTGDMALVAARRAIDDAGLTPRDIDLIILATTTPRRTAPATACFVQHHLGATHAAAFDLAAVCSGFIYSLCIGAQFIKTGLYRHVLIIGADAFSKITDWSRRDCVFFGDGAGAAVLAPCAADEGLLGCDLGADGSEDFAWTILGGGSELPTSRQTIDQNLHYWQMDGKAVYNMAVTRIPYTLARSLERAGLTAQNIQHVVPHQPSIGILKRTAELIGVPFERFHVNMDRYANTSAATIPLVLDEIRRAGKLRSGDNVAFIAVGAGWAWGSAVMRWTE